MAHSVKVGDRVTYLLLPAHKCHDREVGKHHRDEKGTCICAQTCLVTRTGVVTRRYDSCQQIACKGIVECVDCRELAKLEQIDMLVDMTEEDLAMGYVREQWPNRSKGAPHEPGTWIPGPAGDGKTDDTAAVQAVIDAARN